MRERPKKKKKERERHWSKIMVIPTDLNFYLASQVPKCGFGSLQSATTCLRFITQTTVGV